MVQWSVLVFIWTEVLKLLGICSGDMGSIPALAGFVGMTVCVNQLM